MGQNFKVLLNTVFTKILVTRESFFKSVGFVPAKYF